MKLFETRAYLGWENSDTPMIIQVGVACGILAAVILRIILRRESYAMVKSLLLSVSQSRCFLLLSFSFLLFFPFRSLVFCLFCFVLFYFLTSKIYIGGAVVFFIVAIGKQNIIPPTAGIHSLRTCCSQAHLYPS